VGNVDAFGSKFHRLSSSGKVGNLLRFDKVTDSLKVVTFFRHSVYSRTDLVNHYLTLSLWFLLAACFHTFDCESVSSFIRFLGNYDFSEFLRQ